MKDNSIIGDALDYVSSFEHKVDIVLCDPPFLAKTTNYKQIRDNTQNKLEEIEILSRSKLALIFLYCSKLLKKTAWLIFKSDDYTARELYQPLIGSPYLQFSHSVIWDKQSIGLGFYSRKQHEVLEFYRVNKTKSSYYKYKPPKKIPEGVWHGDLKEDKPKCMQSILEIPVETLDELLREGKIKTIEKIPKHNLGNLKYRNQPKDHHVNQTPTLLWERILDAYCPTDGIILDPFCGTKSVLQAAKKLGFTGEYFGCDVKDWSQKDSIHKDFNELLGAI